ncbi:hypothetical protein PtrM4_012540 [Pyrenophora tritici-repentis]|uniref:Uncharacterized protein n=1 Tax=Pyrenophora tritici-repentis TaxID=45151 RepID=A0A834VWA8_9PLEO|nr:hypothetical protein PtrM4_012540 [Pyrenophora tritici-repentis]
MSTSGLYSVPAGRIWCYDHSMGEYVPYLYRQLCLKSHGSALRSGSGVH